jgi:DNA-binding Lrp family transcriptional regulator
MSDTKQVLRKLLQDHVGRHNAVTQSQLAEALGLNTSTLRSELRRLREERNIPIGNLRDGYFVISSKSELQDYIGHINRDIKSRKNTIEDTLEAFEEFDREIEIDPEPEVKEPTYPCAKCDKDVPKSEARRPESGEYADQVLCKHHYGELVMRGEA